MLTWFYTLSEQVIEDVCYGRFTAADLRKMTAVTRKDRAVLSTLLSDNISGFYFIDSLFTVVDCDANLLYFVVFQLSGKTRQPEMASCQLDA